MDIAYDQDGIRIFFKSFGSTTTVVTFAAFGVPPDPVPQNEFHKVLQALSDDPNVRGNVNIITVVDSQRRYYLDGNTTAIVREVNNLIERSKTKRTITLGLSMGGFAAVALARKLHACRSVIAFGARSAVNPSVVPVDKRALEFRSRISHWDVMDCLDELDERIHYHLFYGQDDPMDMRHATRFLSINRPNTRIEILPNCEHNVVDHWIQEGTLKDHLSRLIFTAQRRGAFDLPALWTRLWTNFGPLRRTKAGAPRSVQVDAVRSAPLSDIA